MTPGKRVTTLTPNGASSSRRVSEREFNAALDVAYVAVGFANTPGYQPATLCQLRGYMSRANKGDLTQKENLAIPRRGVPQLVNGKVIRQRLYGRERTDPGRVDDRSRRAHIDDTAPAGDQ